MRELARPAANAEPMTERREMRVMRLVWLAQLGFSRLKVSVSSS